MPGNYLGSLTDTEKKRKKQTNKQTNKGSGSARKLPEQTDIPVTLIYKIAKHITKLPSVGTRINAHHVLKEYYIQDGYLSTSCTKIIGLVES